MSLLPEHVNSLHSTPSIERGYGANLNILDEEYEAVGAKMLSRSSVFETCECIYSLKLLQPCDYAYLRQGQTIVGWTHPAGSGRSFFEGVAQDLNLLIVDLDSVYPRVFCGDAVVDIPFIPKFFLAANSRYAGAASVQHAILSYGLGQLIGKKVAVLSAGQVAQGALGFLCRQAADVDIYTRSNMSNFIQSIGDYDIIVNGIESDSGHIVDRADLKRVKRGALVVDAAADAGGAIAGTRYTNIDSPIYSEAGVHFYVVNNSPSLLYRSVSPVLSEIFSQHVFPIDPLCYRELLLGMS